MKKTKQQKQTSSKYGNMEKHGNLKIKKKKQKEYV